MTHSKRVRGVALQGNCSNLSLSCFVDISQNRSTWHMFKISSQEINRTAFEHKLKTGESHLEMRSAEDGELWIPDLYISNMKTLTNTGFVDHPGIKIDVDADKNIYYSRWAQTSQYSRKRILRLSPCDKYWIL